MADAIAHPLSPQDCLVAVMVAVSASDEAIRTAELVKIESRSTTCRSSPTTISTG
jgi:hypothetical protein